jgi:hypothetical protein
VKLLESLGITFSVYTETIRWDEEGGCYFEIVAEGFGEKGSCILGSSNAAQNDMTSTDGWLVMRINIHTHRCVCVVTAARQVVITKGKGGRAGVAKTSSEGASKATVKIFQTRESRFVLQLRRGEKLQLLRFLLWLQVLIFFPFTTVLYCHCSSPNS